MSAKLSELEDAVDRATLRLKETSDAEDSARREHISALNAYNQATRALDAYLDEQPQGCAPRY